jgi:aldehyde dehydrogenase (NAD+)
MLRSVLIQVASSSAESSARAPRRQELGNATVDVTMTLESFNPAEVRYPAINLIQGAVITGDGAEYEVLRPSDGKLARIERCASVNLVDQAIQTAKLAFRKSGWAQRAPRERARVFTKWAALIIEHGQELAQLESVVSPRLYSDARLWDIKNAAELVCFSAEAADKLEGQTLATAGDALSMVVREPYGVVACITPFNAPIALAVTKIAPALIAGNACVIKPSELTPYSLVRIAQLAMEAGLPEGLLNVVSGTGASTGRALIQHPDIDYVSFTGSTTAGARVMADAALAGVKPVSLELGGKSPHLVFDDAKNLDQLAELIVGSCTRNSGQVCFAGSRLVVHESLATRLIERMQAIMAGMRHGPTWDVASRIGPIMSEAQGLRIEDILQRATAAGTRVLAGGQRAETPHGGVYFQPTILLAASSDSPAVREEFFGPVLTVQTFNDDEEGISIAGHPMFGLAAGIHTSSLDRAFRAARGVSAGSVWINHYGPVPDYNSPFFSPHKQSGLGQEGGMPGVLKYMKSKAIRLRHGFFA